jgi:hypothetical protein
VKIVIPVPTEESWNSVCVVPAVVATKDVAVAVAVVAVATFDGPEFPVASYANTSKLRVRPERSPVTINVVAVPVVLAIV